MGRLSEVSEPQPVELTVEWLIENTKHCVTFGETDGLCGGKNEFSISFINGVVRLAVDPDGQVEIDYDNTLKQMHSIPEIEFSELKQRALQYIDRAKALAESPFKRLKFDPSVPLSEHADHIRKAT